MIKKLHLIHVYENLIQRGNKVESFFTNGIPLSPNETPGLMATKFYAIQEPLYCVGQNTKSGLIVDIACYYHDILKRPVWKYLVRFADSQTPEDFYWVNEDKVKPFFEAIDEREIVREREYVV